MLETMDKKALDRFQQVAIDHHGILITEAQVSLCSFVNNQKLGELKRILEAQVGSLHSEDSYALQYLELELSSFLREETVRQLQKNLSSVLHSLFGGLRLSDVRTEVLASWLADCQASTLEPASDLSSVLADGESGDSVAADPRNDATPDTSEKGVRDDG